MLVAWCVLLLYLGCFVQQVEPSGVFQLKINKYVSDGTDSEGQCCGESCPGVCRTFFRTCLTHVGRDPPNLDLYHLRRLDVNTPCTFGLFVSDVIGNNSLEADKELNYNFTYDFPWPGQFRLIIESWHTPNGTVPLEGSFRRESRPFLYNFRNFGRSEWFLDLATRVLDIPDRWIQKRISFDFVGGKSVPEGKLIQRFTLKRQLDIGWDWKEWDFQEDSPRAHVGVQYRVMCNPGYTGANCTEECPSPNDIKPRFKCLKNGTKECMPGWSGKECDVPVCREGCDLEHGYCEQPGECLCKIGWEGDTCDNCVPMPGCVHGTCNSTFECNCEDGWDGFFCSRPMCGEGCHPTRGYCDYPQQCNCRFGWQGERCDSCKPLPGCVHGYCNKPLECICEEGWMGIFCHIPVCSAKCHYEHGYCTKPNDCRCRVGWTGENCDECFPYPGCQNGNCSKPWECNCEPGWGGLLCDQKLTFCDDNAPCENGATCISKTEDDGLYQCACPESFAGRNCTVPIRKKYF